MKLNRLNTLLLPLLLVAPGIALAQPGQTCAEAIQIFSDSSVSGDTCGSVNGIGALGPLPSPHNDLIYFFVADGASATISMPAASYDYGVFLTSGCAGTTPAPTQAATGPAAGGSFPVGGLTDGNTYYVIVSGNPSVDTPSCGTFDMNIDGQLPVELQSFSID